MRLVLLLILSFSCLFADIPIESLSIVPKDEQISDFEARLALADLYLLDESMIDESMIDESKREEALLLFTGLIEERPCDLSLHYERGRVLSLLGRYEEAEKEFEYVLSCDNNFKIESSLEDKIYMEEEPMYIIKKIDRVYPSDEEAIFSLAEAYDKNLQTREAIDTYKYLINREKKPPKKALIALGNIYINRGLADEALVYYKKALEMDSSYEIKMKVAQLLSWTKNFDESFRLLSDLSDERGDDPVPVVEISRIYQSLGDLPGAKLILENHLKKDPDNILVNLERALIEANLGYISKAENIYERTLPLAGKEGYIHYADVMQVWGAFDIAEKKYKEYLPYADRDRPEIELKLAWLYVSTGRFYEAEAIYRKIIKNERYYVRATLEFSKALIHQKDYDRAILLLLDFLKIYPDKFDMKELLARAYFKSKRYEEAIQEYSTLEGHPFYAKGAGLALGEIYYSQKNFALAAEYFKKVRRDDQRNIEAAFYLDLLLVESLDLDSLSSEELVDLGFLYLQNGAYEIAADIFEQALKKNIDNDRAYIGLGESFAVNYDFDKAINILNGLILEFPENYQLQLTRARVLAWSRRYEESIQEYEKLRKRNPEIFSLTIEEARVAVWQENIKLSMCLYDSLLSPSVDSLLKSHLLKIINKDDCPNLYNDLTIQGFVYQGYEFILNKLNDGKYNLPEDKKEAIEGVFEGLEGIYGTQKGVFLEKRSKSLIWDKRYAQSLTQINKALSYDKANEELMFDLAQSQCKLGLCDRSKKTYSRIIETDPLHKLARLTLDRNIILSEPSVEIRPSYWDESGLGLIDRIRRVKVITNLNIPFFCRHSLYASYDYYLEMPEFTGKSYHADGFTVGNSFVFSPYVKSRIVFRKKYYKDSMFKNTTTGNVFLAFNINDYLHLGFSYGKEDMLDNYFSLVQKTQMDSWVVSYETDFTHKINLRGSSWLVKYNDDNPGQFHFLDLTYAFTELPMIFRMGLAGEYRDLKHVSSYVYNSKGDVIDILYPYWSPQNYDAIRVIFDFYHDLSKYLICGEAKHIYYVKMAFGTDSTKNDAFYVEGAWLLQLKDRFDFSLRVMIHRQIEWNSSGALFTFKVRF